MDSTRTEKFKVKLLESDKEVHKLEWEVINLLNSNQVLPLKTNNSLSPCKVDIPVVISPIKLKSEKSPAKLISDPPLLYNDASPALIQSFL